MPKRVWVDFGLNTTIHGLYHIFHSKKPWNFVWLIIFLFTLFLTTWSTTLFVMKYLRYNVKTTITIVNAIETTTNNLQLDRLDFPSITFCPSHALVKSEAKKSQIAITADSMAKSYNLQEAAHFIYVNFNKFYKPNGSSEDTITYNDFVDPENFEAYSRRFGFDSFKTVKGCWWNKLKIECDSLFFNHVLDPGLCFTFNPSIPWLYEGLNRTGYGFNGFKEKMLEHGGPNTGIRLLMSVNVTEACCYYGWKGIGYIAKMHHKMDGTPVFFVDQHMKFGAGFEYSVQIKPTVYRRKSAHLGRCNNPIYISKLLKNPFYNQAICLQACLTEKILQICNCTLWYAKGNEELFELVLGYPLKKYKECDYPQLQHVKRVWSDLIGGNLEESSKACKRCKQACYETKYDYDISAKAFPANSFFQKGLLKSLNSSLDIKYIKKNYFVTDFFFGSLKVPQVVETQEITIPDVLMFFGSTLGLLLGMSFVSPFEIVQIIVDLIVHSIQMVKIRRRRRQRVSQYRAVTKFRAGSKVNPITSRKKLQVQSTVRKNLQAQSTLRKKFYTQSTLV